MGISSEHKSKYAALYRQLWRLQMSEQFSSGTENSKQTNTQQLFVMIYFLFSKCNKKSTTRSLYNVFAAF